ncbi:hypothetical protein CRG98_031213 [Punica granatum]|uniref:Retroviral polymerase SH3-like domain-containing protein n=1 Tax=Punica granatum TaxID=22663 RepID=A0A2I0IXH1_PUNGR|nr:hypothetical protein CRG98_031213 [Punica granatum]
MSSLALEMLHGYQKEEQKLELSWPEVEDRVLKRTVGLGELRRGASLPTRFWGESVAMAAYLVNNVMPTPILGGKSPYEILFQRKPTYSNLRVFGSLCYAHHQPHGKDKFVERSRRYIFVGYPHRKKGWWMFDLEKEDFFISRDVRFCENEFSFKKIGCTMMTAGNPLFLNQIWDEGNVEAEGELDGNRNNGIRQNSLGLSSEEQNRARVITGSPQESNLDGSEEQVESGPRPSGLNESAERRAQDMASSPQARRPSRS